jgi:hypothetical protein
MRRKEAEMITLFAGTTQREMSRYQCHKQVWALKIKEIETTERTASAVVLV